MTEKIHTVTLIGAGGVATSLAPAINMVGMQIECIYSRNILNAKTIASQCNCNATDSLPDIPLHSDLYIICVTDDAVQSIAAQLKLDDNSICVHTAGSLSMNLLSDVCKNYGVFYPMQTFSRGRIVPYDEVPVFIEGNNDETIQRLHIFASQLSHNVHDLDEVGRRKLHLAAVIACNFSNHCYAIADELLKQQGLTFSVLLPLVDETAKKVHSLSPFEAQTGPAVRNNQSVLDRHKSILAERKDLLEIYNLLTRHIIETHTNKNHD